MDDDNNNSSLTQSRGEVDLVSLQMYKKFMTSALVTVKTMKKKIQDLEVKMVDPLETEEDDDE